MSYWCLLWVFTSQLTLLSRDHTVQYLAVVLFHNVQAIYKTSLWDSHMQFLVSYPFITPFPAVIMPCVNEVGSGISHSWQINNLTSSIPPLTRHIKLQYEANWVANCTIKVIHKTCKNIRWYENWEMLIKVKARIQMVEHCSEEDTYMHNMWNIYLWALYESTHI